MIHFVSIKKTSRAGGILIEAIIASALLVTATTSLARYVVSSHTLSVAADQRLASRLVCENTIERLRSVPAKDWPIQAETIAQAASAASGIRTRIEMNSFQIGDRDAWHATIRCQTGRDQKAFQESHAWKVVK